MLNFNLKILCILKLYVFWGGGVLPSLDSYIFQGVLSIWVQNNGKYRLQYSNNILHMSSMIIYMKKPLHLTKAKNISAIGKNNMIVVFAKLSRGENDTIILSSMQGTQFPQWLLFMVFYLVAKMVTKYQLLIQLYCYSPCPRLDITGVYQLVWWTSNRLSTSLVTKIILILIDRFSLIKINLVIIEPVINFMEYQQQGF